MNKLLFALALLGAGCGAYIDVDARFIAYNRSNHEVTFEVNSVPHKVGAKGSAEFEVEIPIRQNPVYNGGTGPSSVDKTTRVSVSVIDPTLKFRTDTIMCTSGAKVINHLTYEISGSTPRVQCDR